MLTLTAGESSLVLMPEQGGTLLGWTRSATRLLRHAAPEAVVLGDAREAAAFPLVPYSNRIANGRFTFAGIPHQLALNFGLHPNSIHGVGWQRPWQVTRTAADAATLALPHAPDQGWPFAFTAEQHIHLTPDSLEVGFALTNRHAGPAPAGLGLHPFFPRAGASLRFNAGTVWRNGPTMLPTGETAIPPDWDHHTPRAVGSVVLDNCFAGWDGIATLAWPDRTLTLAASNIFRHLVVFTPPGADFFCVEPVSHRNDAINHGGMAVLAPGETLRGSITMRLS